MTWLKLSERMVPKDFESLLKTLSLMERKHQIRFEEDGSLTLDQKKKHEITLKGTFHAHKNGFGFVSLEGEEDDLFVGKNDVNYAIDGDTVEIVIKKVADRQKGNCCRGKDYRYFRTQFDDGCWSNCS